MTNKKKEEIKFQEIVGENIEKYRMARGMSLEELAYSSQLDDKNILKLEHGQQSPMAFTIARLAKALEIEPNALYEGTEKYIEVLPHVPNPKRRRRKKK
ncbi:helix-turn-helix domain-containing protein [Oceanobacillus luteolus]|uniref:Helix-turn-helix domain-containing protein n=1 Tax=Oceanobacillus luteolus TaxID=1274358 RepID=A0ABW4HUE2_9BACI|nr:helix-turn-helix transcriptional regulator [Oceanobacillus luteolus]MCM3742115.1 helix-turn-helix domain-containing protein [Oceanobacillus luteolus]